MAKRRPTAGGALAAHGIPTLGFPDLETGSEKPLVICVAGNPNVGKSSLFNSLTGAACETGHCAGVTTEATAVCASWGGRCIELIDLPGVYGLDASGGDQEAARAALLRARPDLVVAVVDATNLARNLYLVLQLLDLGGRVVVALNLVDEARRRAVTVDAARLGDELGVPVVPTVAPRGQGLDDLTRVALEVATSENGAGRGRPRDYGERVERRLDELASVVEERCETVPFGLSSRGAALALLEGDTEVSAAVGLAVGDVLTSDDDGLALLVARARHDLAQHAASASSGAATRRGAATLWRATTSPLTGLPILIGVTAAMFAVLFVVGDLLARGLTALWAATFSPAITQAAEGLFGVNRFSATLLWGLDGGILAILAVGIPYILTFYFLLALLEDSGYLNAAAFLSDRVMHRFGLHGRAVIPLIAAGGCNVPAVIATRSLTSMRERAIASTLIALTPCSARTAVILGAVALVAGWQWTIFVYGVLLLVGIAAGIGLNRLLPGKEGPLVMEMFPFRRPVVRQVATKTWRRFREFVWDAAPIILIGSLALGALYEYGVVWRLTEPLAPIVEDWLLLPPVAGLTLLFAVLRKELALQLLIAFAAVAVGSHVSDLSQIMTSSQLVTYAIVNSIYIPCVATIAVLGRELGWRRTAYISFGTIALSLLVGGLIARVVPLLGG